MRILLDTHVFLWYITASPKLPDVYQNEIRNSSNAVYLSAASVWEAVIKYGLGKLPLPESPVTYFPRQRLSHHIGSLPIDEAALEQLTKLPSLHRDPFDRILMAQAIQHRLTIAAVDDVMRKYSDYVQFLDS